MFVIYFFDLIAKHKETVLFDSIFVNKYFIELFESLEFHINSIALQ